MIQFQEKKRPPIGNIETPRNIIKLSIPISSSEYYCNLIVVVYASISPLNVLKNTTPDAISISEHFKQYSKPKSRNTSHVVEKPSPHPPQIVRIGEPPIVFGFTITTRF